MNGQSIDLREKNSWTMRMHEVSTPELAEVFAINAMAPFIINARLKGLMTRGRDLPPSVARHSWRKDGQADVDALARMLPPSLREAMLGDLVSEDLRPGGALRSAAAAAGASAAGVAGGAEDAASCSDAAAAAGGAGGPPSKRPRREAPDAAAAAEAAAAKKERAAASARRSGLAGVSKLLGDVAAAVPASLCRFVINVSAMEGKFARAKTPAHPHTNMAKAALNMQTRTAAQDYAELLIFMNAVDTGVSVQLGCGCCTLMPPTTTPMQRAAFITPFSVSFLCVLSPSCSGSIWSSRLRLPSGRRSATISRHPSTR